jgi:hypothetical protein
MDLIEVREDVYRIGYNRKTPRQATISLKGLFKTETTIAQKVRCLLGGVRRRIEKYIESKFEAMPY